jgi:cytochrome c-type biogenesis protein CcmH
MTEKPAPNPLAPIALDEAQSERVRKLYSEIRCLVCQNQSLADSAADLAVDLRHEVQLQIARGSSDTQIKRWLVDRYGDFVLYRPPLQPSTALLWAGPFAALGAGALIWTIVQRRRKRAEAEVSRFARSSATPPSTEALSPALASKENRLERARQLLNHPE